MMNRARDKAEYDATIKRLEFLVSLPAGELCRLGGCAIVAKATNLLSWMRKTGRVDPHYAILAKRWYLMAEKRG